jgi:molybdate transport system substrate-binding protein
MRLPVFFLSVLSLICVQTARADTLAIAVAANMQYAFAELQTEFEAQSSHKVRASFNASGRFATQIQLGAPIDVFISADMEFPQKLHEAGFAASAPIVYAKGAMVLWSLKGIDLANWKRTLVDLGVQRVAVANPVTAPYGREAMRALTFYKLESVLKPKLVFGESIGQVNQYVSSQTVDVGFTAKSVVVSSKMKDVGKWVDVPPESYQTIEQGVVITTWGAQHHATAAKEFQTFLLSPAGRAILRRNGYLAP